MRQKPAQNKRASARRNPFDRAAYRRWIMRAVATDQMACKAAARRFTATGETLH